MSIPEKFTDRFDNAFMVTASDSHQGHVYLEMLSNNPGRWIPGEDAPAVALAILEAAGWNDDGPDHDEYDPVNVILTNLRDIIQDLADEKRRAERAEREAEDAKVNDFRNAICADDWTSWSEVPEDAKENLRIQYRAAREFFKAADGE